MEKRYRVKPPPGEHATVQLIMMLSCNPFLHQFSLFQVGGARWRAP